MASSQWLLVTNLWQSGYGHDGVTTLTHTKLTEDEALFHFICQQEFLRNCLMCKKILIF